MEATDELCDENGDSFPAAIGIVLTPDSNYEYWNGTIFSNEPLAATIRFDWIEGGEEGNDEDWREGEAGDPGVPSATVGIEAPLTSYLSSAH